MGLDLYCRQEAIALSGANGNRLSYLDRQGLVVPEKFGNPKRPVVLYNARQLLQVAAAETFNVRPCHLERFLLSFPDPIEPHIHSAVYLIDGIPYWVGSHDDPWAMVTQMLSGNSSICIQKVGPLAELWQKIQLHTQQEKPPT